MKKTVAKIGEKLYNYRQLQDFVGHELHGFREEVIRLKYENQNLKEENKGLREKLDKAYEFMKKFVIEGRSMLDKFLEWIGEKIREGRGR